MLSKISLDFFYAIYNNPALRSGCYHQNHSLCGLHYEIFEILCQNSEALAQITDEDIYKLQQQWLPIEKSKVTEFFDNNPELMQRWLKAYNIKKIA